MGDGQRVPYLSTILLTEIMFLVMLTTFVPISKQVPNLVVLFFALASVLSLVCAITIIIEWFEMARKKEKDMGNKVKDEKEMKKQISL